MRPGQRVIEHLDRLCVGHEGDWMVRIRLHPDDQAALREECRELGFRDPGTGLPVLSGPGGRVDVLMPLAGVPIVGDESLLDGPVIDWEPAPLPILDLKEVIRRLIRD